MRIAMRIKQAREKRGFSQAELARRASLTPAAISQFEAGDREPSLASLGRLANALGASTEHLMGREVDEKFMSNPDVSAMFRGMSKLNDADKQFILSVFEEVKKRAQSKDNK